MYYSYCTISTSSSISSRCTSTCTVTSCTSNTSSLTNVCILICLYKNIQVRKRVNDCIHTHATKLFCHYFRFLREDGVDVVERRVLLYGSDFAEDRLAFLLRREPGVEVPRYQLRHGAGARGSRRTSGSELRHEQEEYLAQCVEAAHLFHFHCVSCGSRARCCRRTCRHAVAVLVP